MTVVTGPATDVATVEMFFDAHRRRDIEAMVESCSRGAEFRYHPFEMPGTQRTLSGRGKVWGIGKTIWVGMIDAFPDLTNEVTSIRSDGRGNVAVEAVLSGTQAASWGPCAPRGQSFSEPHFFVLHVGADGLIDAVSAYWDDAAVRTQLGHLEVD